MLRRNFIRAIGYTTIAVPWIATAQQSSSKVWRIAYLYPGSLAAPGDRAISGVFRAEMATMGYVEGKSLIIDDRSAEGKLERLPWFLTELIALRPDVIVAITTAAIAAAQKATSTIPIIMAPSVDPVGSGFVKSRLIQGETLLAWPPWLATPWERLSNFSTTSCHPQNGLPCSCPTIHLIHGTTEWLKLPSKAWPDTRSSFGSHAGRSRAGFRDYEEGELRCFVCAWGCNETSDCNFGRKVKNTSNFPIKSLRSLGWTGKLPPQHRGDLSQSGSILQ